jgi:glycosyltransferase involved in cell wall biosynthesis
MLGEKANPYPYINQCDIYVQTSRYEGKSIAIDEAKCLLKPIVVTNFPTVFDQSVTELTGLSVK